MAKAPFTCNPCWQYAHTSKKHIKGKNTLNRQKHLLQTKYLISVTLNNNKNIIYKTAINGKNTKTPIIYILYGVIKIDLQLGPQACTANHITA